MMQAIRPEREILLICDVEYFPPGSKFEGVQTEVKDVVICFHLKLKSTASG